MRAAAALLLPIIFTACAAVDDGSQRDTRQGTVTPQDYFFYSCVREYMASKSIPVFDGSTAYAVEYMDAPHEVIENLYVASKKFASALPSPNYADTEHGLPAVLVTCRKESETERVKQLVDEGMRRFAERLEKGD